jgi:class 3 adenylate cyclase
MSDERRLVTVLFADVTGSTALGEQVDPEDLRALLGRYYAIAREVVAGHGGTLEKFIGDAVMAIFGLPQAHGDDAVRALAAALELRDRVRADPQLGESLPIRLGVDSGEVVATRDQQGAADFLVTGDAVNTAARLQQAAEPWAVLVGERAAHAAAHAFEFGPLQHIEARGKARPVAAAALVGPARRSGPSIPIFGRDADLAQLDLVAARAFDERRPFLVSVIAPPGTGKTRLLEAFLDRLSAVAPAAAVAVAQCLPYGQRLTYWPMRATLYRLAGLDEDAESADVRRDIERWLAELGVEEPARVAGLLAATIGVGDGDAPDSAAVFTAWRTALEAAASHRPLVIVFEDLHWSSDSLLDLVEFIMQPRADTPVLMLALTRPELLDRRPTWGGGRRNHVSLALEPLSDSAVARLVTHLLEAAPSSVIDLVVQRAEGNPFFAGEIVRSVMERAGGETSEDAFAHAIGTLPDTVQATVLSRLDLLPPDARRCLQLGAVFGRAFRAAGLTALAPDLADRVEAALDQLVDRDMARPSGADGYTFRHILIREVAYGTLPRAERARLHAAAARWLESRARDQDDHLAEVIAYHYREAASLATLLDADDAREVRAASVRWSARAADVAWAAAANLETARHLRSAIEYADSEQQVDLYQRLGRTMISGSESRRAYETGLRIATEIGSPAVDRLRLAAGLLEVVTRFHGSVGSAITPADLQELIGTGRDLMTKVDDRLTVASYLVAEGSLGFLRSSRPEFALIDVAESERSALRGLEIAREEGDARLQSAALDALAGLGQGGGQARRALEYSRERVQLRDQLDLQERIDAEAMVVWNSALLGLLEDGAAVAEDGLRFVRPGQALSWTLHLLAWQAYTLTLLGRWDEALAAAERSRAVWIEMERGPSAFAMIGFVSALDISRARRSDGVERWRDSIRAVMDQFGPDPLHDRIRLHEALDVPALAGLIVSLGMEDPRIAYVERIASLCADHIQPVEDAALERLTATAGERQLVIIEAQFRRVLGNQRRDATQLERAVELLDESRAAPYAARARCELALVVRGSAEDEPALGVLEALGDVDQVERYRARGTP